MKAVCLHALTSLGARHARLIFNWTEATEKRPGHSHSDVPNWEKDNLDSEK
jgi:hypothetical protein